MTLSNKGFAGVYYPHGSFGASYPIRILTLIDKNTAFIYDFTTAEYLAVPLLHCYLSSEYLLLDFMQYSPDQEGILVYRDNQYRCHFVRTEIIGITFMKVTFCEEPSSKLYTVEASRVHYLRFNPVSNSAKGDIHVE